MGLCQSLLGSSSLKPQGSSEFLVTYTFGTSKGHCQSRAVVTTTQRDNLNLIEQIHEVEVAERYPHHRTRLSPMAIRRDRLVRLTAAVADQSANITVLVGRY